MNILIIIIPCPYFTAPLLVILTENQTDPDIGETIPYITKT